MAITREDTLLTPELIEEYTAAGYWSDETLADVFRRDSLSEGNVVQGPALVDAPDTTIWVPAGRDARLSPAGALVIEERG